MNGHARGGLTVDRHARRLAEQLSPRDLRDDGAVRQLADSIADSHLRSPGEIGFM
jgi:hypothetical protein